MLAFFFFFFLPEIEVVNSVFMALNMKNKNNVINNY